MTSWHGGVVDCFIVCTWQTIPVAAVATIHGFMACSQTCTGTLSEFFFVTSVGLGAVDAWLIAFTQQATSGAVFALVVPSLGAIASFYYENPQYLGNSDKDDLTIANVQAYRQFPGISPIVADDFVMAISLPLAEI